MSPDQLRRGQRLAESRGHNIKTAASDVRTRSEETRHPDQSPPCHVRGERGHYHFNVAPLKTSHISKQKMFRSEGSLVFCKSKQFSVDEDQENGLLKARRQNMFEH